MATDNFVDLLKTHKKMYNAVMNPLINELVSRSQEHDLDKLYDPRIFKVYQKHFPELKKIEFGTEEYLKYEHDNFYQAHMLHAQKRHHFYSSKNQETTDPNLIDLLEVVVDIYVSNKQYNKTANKQTVMDALEMKGVFNVDLKEFVENTVDKLENLNK